MSKVIIEFDTEKDSRLEINAAIKADLLALTIWEIKERVRTEYEHCEMADRMDILIIEVNEIIEKRIGDIEDYTE